MVVRGQQMQFSGPIKEIAEDSQWHITKWNATIILDSTPSRKIDKTIDNIYQSFIPPRIIAAAQIGFFALKALHLSFQIPDSNLANICSVIEKRLIL